MYHFFKRVIDLVIAGVAFLIFLPFLLPVVIALRLTGEGYVWYFQDRIGFKNKVFQIWKFATMLKNSPNIGTGSITLRNDARVTPVGKYLRGSKVNELPQVINVLMGNMSIVGPRPQMRVDYECYPQHVQAHIYDAKPGITGIGSIIFRDEEKFLSEPGIDPRAYSRDVIMPYKGEVELWYQQHASIWLDIQLIFLTAWCIVSPETDLPNRMFKDLPKFNP